MNNRDYESYDKLKSEKIDAELLLEWHFSYIVRSVSRKITFRQKFKNPWTVEVTESIQSEVFIKAFQAIRDYKIDFGRSIDVKRNRLGAGIRYTIKFDHFGALKFHLSKLSKLENIVDLFKKESKKGSATVIVSQEKYTVIDYDCKKSILKISLHYEVKNKYGIVCSF